MSDWWPKIPNYAKPVGQSGPYDPAWNAVIGAIQRHADGIGVTKNQPRSTQTVTDMWGNSNEVSGTNLDQTVTIGASHNQQGVLVSTNIGTAGAPISGRAGATGVRTFTLQLQAGATAATASSTAGLTAGMVIGALSVAPSQPTVPYPTSLGLNPGTTISTIAGTLISLSENALVTGTGLYAAACTWTQLTTY